MGTGGRRFRSKRIPRAKKFSAVRHRLVVAQQEVAARRSVNSPRSNREVAVTDERRLRPPHTSAVFRRSPCRRHLREIEHLHVANAPSRISPRSFNPCTPAGESGAAWIACSSVMIFARRRRGDFFAGKRPVSPRCGTPLPNSGAPRRCPSSSRLRMTRRYRLRSS